MYNSQNASVDNTGQYIDPVSGPTGQYDAVARSKYLEIQKAQQMAAQGLNPDGSPVKPGYNSQLDKNTGLLKDPYQLKAPVIDYNNVDSYNMYKKASMDTGLSPWAKMQQELLQNQQNQDLSNMAGKSAQAGAQARSGLAMRGGLSNAQRTQIATGGARDLMMGNQGIYQQGAQNLLNIGAQDAQNKQSMLSQVMGIDTGTSKANTLNAADTQKYNIGNALNEQQNQNTWNMDTYKEQMQKWAAGKQADATAASGGGGGGGK